MKLFSSLTILLVLVHVVITILFAPTDNSGTIRNADVTAIVRFLHTKTVQRTSYGIPTNVNVNVIRVAISERHKNPKIAVAIVYLSITDDVSGKEKS